MPHGLPDWWGAAPKSTTYGLQDMAELAARLGSIVTYDRRGDVIWLEDFTRGVNRVYRWGTGTGYDVWASVANPLSGSIHCQLMAGSAAGNMAGITKELPYPVLGKIGLECAFTVQTNTRYFELRIIEYLTTAKNVYVARYAHQTGKVYVLHSTGSYIEVGAPGQLYGGYNDFNIMKVVVDLLNNKYVRLLLNQHLYLVSAYAPQTTAGTYVKCLGVDAYFTANAAGNQECSIDNFIVTQNEPA